MRDQAHAARQAQLAAQASQAHDVMVAQENAIVQKHAADQEVKDRTALLEHYRGDEKGFRQDVDDDSKKLAEAERKGDTAAAQEIREHQASMQGQLTMTQGLINDAQRHLDDANVAVAERTREFNEVHQKMQQIGDNSAAAEKQIDALEDKARMLGEAGRKLELAGTIDNPVDRAAMELDAEKLLKNANAIDVKTDDITKFTGQEVQLPDVGALPDATTTAGDTTTPAGDTTTSGGDTAPADAAPADGTSSDSDPSTSQSPPDTDAAASGTSGHLDDEFAAVTASDGAAAGAIGADSASADTSGFVASDTTDELLGVSASGTGDTAAVDTSQPVDAMASTTEPSLVSDADSAGFSTPTDSTFDQASVTIDAADATPDAATDFSPVEPVDDANTTDDAEV